MSRKQTKVSPASVNTTMVKKTKKLVKLVVSGVKFAGELRKVRFVARKNPRGDVVIARSKGFPAVRIRRSENAKGREQFVATCRESAAHATAKSPDQAFARGVRYFWAA